MKRLAKTLYLLNSITTVFIGILHTVTHYQSLISDEIKERLDYDIIVTGIETNVWKLWQGMSLMMGFLLIIIGLLHFSFLYKSKKEVLYKSKKEEYPPIIGSIIMILMLLFVVYIGCHYFSAWQIYGGAAGIFLQSICLVLSIRGIGK